MSTELAIKMYENIGKIKHLRTFEFLKAIEENIGPDGFSRITYARWRDVYKLHAFILNECTNECLELGFIEIARENKNGVTENGGKGTKRIYKLLTLTAVDNKENGCSELIVNRGFEKTIEKDLDTEILVRSVEEKSERSNNIPVTEIVRGKKLVAEPKATLRKTKKSTAKTSAAKKRTAVSKKRTMDKKASKKTGK